MEPSHLDHANLTIPADRVDDAVAFYRDALGFDLEDLDAYRAGDRPIFSIRLSATSLIHVRPSEEFDPRRGGTSTTSPSSSRSRSTRSSGSYRKQASISNARLAT
ncbi:hypothetical protein SY89_02648 [Halolamina pelagica]|uniref:VOC domain-containing protein n=1 Tax=Halolamina pelagica TaxID=699431 RepID=A0A0N8I0C1_9EURY|nr:hypothetical protein SY89_02648 [Halolamina pelagica]